MSCSRWNEIDFVKYTQDEFNPPERKVFEVHLSECSDCRERFSLCYKVILSEDSPEDNEAIQELLNSKKWQDSKQELVRKFSNILRKRSNHNGKAMLKVA